MMLWDDPIIAAAPCKYWHVIINLWNYVNINRSIKWTKSVAFTCLNYLKVTEVIFWLGI